VKARIAAGIVAAGSLLCALALAVAVFQGYWRHRACFDENGRCFVPEDGAVHSADSLFLAPLALVFGILCIAASRYAARR
jgi:hypothetical protein